MHFLKQSTASQSVLIGPFVDSTDGVTAETGLTINASDIRLSANGGNMAAKNSGGGTHDENGWYTITLDATDTATVGRLQVSCAVSGALPVFSEYQVLEEAVYDALFGSGATGELEVDVVKVAGQTASAAGTVDFDDLAIIEAVTTGQGATGGGLSAIPWNSSWDTEVQSECTDALNAYDPPTKGELDSGLASLNDLSAADVNAEVDTALADIHLDHLLAADYDPASKPGTSTALLNELIESDGGVSRFTANALEQAPSGGGTVDANITQIEGRALAGTGTQIADAFEHFFNVATPSKTINDCGVAGSGLSAEDVWTYGTRVLTANTNLNDPTAAAIRAEIDSNSTQLAAIVADTNEMQGDLADGGRLDLIFDAILVDTGTTIPSTLSAIGSSVDGNSTAISLVSDSVNDMQGATFNTATDSLEAIRNQGDAAWITATGFATSAALATVDTNVDTLITQLTTDVSEPGVPGATATVPEMLATLYGALRNRIDVTSSAKTFYNDAGSSVWSKSLSDDGTTYTEAEGS